MGIASGFLIIFIAGYIPALIPIGIYWPILLVSIPSAILGVSGKINIFSYITGIILGSIIYIVLNFSSWGNLSVMLAFFQLMPTLASIIVFSIFWSFAPIKAHNKAVKRDQ